MNEQMLSCNPYTSLLGASSNQIKPGILEYFCGTRDSENQMK